MGIIYTIDVSIHATVQIAADNEECAVEYANRMSATQAIKAADCTPMLSAELNSVTDDSQVKIGISITGQGFDAP